MESFNRSLFVLFLKGMKSLQVNGVSVHLNYAAMQQFQRLIRNFSDQQVMEIALIENVQREDLNAIEIAFAYQALMDKFALTQEELSMKVGKSRSHIANFLRLLITAGIKSKNNVSRGTLSMGHARALLV